MATVRDLLRSAERLASDSPRRDAEVLLCHCLDKTRTWLYAWPDSDVPPECERRFTELLSRRECGQPVAYLTGQREFWSLSLAVSDGLSRTFREVDVETDVGNGKLLAYLAAHGEVLSRSYNQNRVTVHCRMPQKYLGRIQDGETIVRPRGSNGRPVDEPSPQGEASDAHRPEETPTDPALGDVA